MNSQEATDLYMKKADAMLPETTDNPLHVAASLGLPNFVKEILDSNPEYALGLNGRGLTPCHLAVANGHVSAVKQLMESKVGLDICLLRDVGGFLPIHVAVMKGKLDVFMEVRDKCSLSMLREPTPGGGGSILHVAVRFDSVSAFRHLSELLCGDEELFNRRDDEGNTVLHLALVRRQLQIVKMLIEHSNNSSRLEVNAKNKNDSTALDLFYDLGFEETDIKLGETIKRAGGKKALELEQKKETCQLQIEAPELNPAREKIFTLRQRFFSIKIGLLRRASSDKDRETGNTLMVVATLIATVTLQGALNPHGGIIQEGTKAGQAVLESGLDDFLLYDVIALVSSLTVIMLTTYIVPKWKVLIKLAKLLIWISVFFTLWSFLYAVPLIFPKVSSNRWIKAVSVLGDFDIQLFALFLMGMTWYFLYKRFFTFLYRRSPKGLIAGPKRIALVFLPLLGAYLLWGPWLSLDLVSYFLPVVTYYPTFFNSPPSN